MLDAKHDIRQLQRLRQRFDPRDVNKALRWAVDGTTRKAATYISRDIRDIYAIKAGDIRRRLQIRRVERDAARALLYTGRRLPLEQFAPKAKTVRVMATSNRGKRFRTKRRGVTVRVRKDQGRTLVKGGWLAKDHVLRRADRSDSRSDPRIQFGPSIPGMVAHPETIEGAEELIREELPRSFSERLEYIIGRKG